MIAPDLVSFKKLARKGNVIALAETFPADLETPVSSFLKISRSARNAFLLESAEQEEKIGRFSFLGIEPAAVYESSEKHVVVTDHGRRKLLKDTRLLDVLERELGKRKLANPEAFPGFRGGFVGYLSYENVRDFETIRLTPKKGPKFPLGIFFRVEDFVVFDHFRKTLSIVILVNTDKFRSVGAAYKNGLEQMSKYRQLLQKPLRVPAPNKAPVPAVRPNMTRAAFESKVRKIKEYIRAGDCIQVVLSQRFALPYRGDDFRIYRSLRSINPSPYMFYLRSGTFRLIGSSPEMLVKKTKNLAEVRPIAGTRPRGATEAQDLAYEKQLKASRKEMAEHLMLVDLGRNDLGRVSEFRSVKVEKFAFVERYSHVMHLVSRVQSRLRPGKTAMDLLRATFPAGTLSGAPKVRAMQIIDELEPETRGPYGGSLGYFGFDGDMDMCITIRTLMLHGNEMYLQAGAGIVKDSNPGREYEETVNKSRALLKAIEERLLF
ncbi:MAG TPA: anthranilate synthase component I [Candidatus Omnitrophota bacterium]|nr:anthranilate synthase component I [Candidatus Omnitrophota bacterium]HPS37145.1 anthranilate synthase component I [Candidatus Omnitrophota bacterium]